MADFFSLFWVNAINLWTDDMMLTQAEKLHITTEEASEM